MSNRKVISGTRSCVLWLFVFIAVVLAIGMVVGVLFILPQIRAEQALEQHYQAGVAFQNMGDWAAAEEEYKQVIALDANYKDVQARLAEVKARLAENAATATAVAIAQAEQAQAEAQATAAAAPAATAEALEAHYQKGLGFMNIGRWEEAKAELEQVFAVDPNYKDVQTSLAETDAEIAKRVPAASPTRLPTNTPKPSPTPKKETTYTSINYTFYSFESHNYPGHYVRHRDSLGELTTISSDLDKKDATFKFVPGLADDRCISLESRNLPGYYLRHQDYRVKLHAPDGTQLFREDATFCIQYGLADNSKISFESYNYPGRYLRHRDFHLWVESGDGDLFRKDATFRDTNPWWP